MDIPQEDEWQLWMAMKCKKDGGSWTRHNLFSSQVY